MDRAGGPLGATTGDGPPASAAFLTLLLALAFTMNMVGRGVTEAFAVFLLPVERAFGATRSEVSLAYSIYMVVHGLAAPFAGQLIDRLGARVTYCAGLSALGLGYVAAGSAGALWQYYLAAGVLGGLGASCLGMVVASSLLARWFERRMGAIMALPYAAVGAGVLVVPPLLQLVVDAGGWRLAHRAAGLAALVLVPIVLALPLARMTAGSPAWQRTRSAAAAGTTPAWTLAAAVRTDAFWGLFGAYFATSVAAYAVLPQSVAHLVESGFSPLAAAGAFGLTGLLSTAGILAMGTLSDRIGRRQAATISYVLTIAGVAALMAVAWHPSWALVYGFIVCFGAMQGVRGPIIVAMVATLFRGGGVGAIFGALSLALGLGAGLGSWASGLLHDLTGSYVASFSLAIAGALAGMSLFWIVPSLRDERLAGDR